MPITNHVVIHCQSTDINGLPTSIEVIVTPFNIDKDITNPEASFYCEISGYSEDVKYSETAKEMFVHRKGVEPTTPEWAIYNLYNFLATHARMSGGLFRPIVYGYHSLKVLEKLIDYTMIIKKIRCLL